METSLSLRIDGNAKQWGGNNSPQGDRQNRRRQKLQALLQALQMQSVQHLDVLIQSMAYIVKLG